MKKYEEDPTAVLAPNYRHSQKFTVQQEKTLEDYLVTCSQMFHGFTPKNARKLSYEMAHKNGIKMLPKRDEKSQAGEDRFTAFLKRHPTLSIRSPKEDQVMELLSANPTVEQPTVEVDVTLPGQEDRGQEVVLAEPEKELPELAERHAADVRMLQWNHVKAHQQRQIREWNFHLSNAAV